MTNGSGLHSQSSVLLEPNGRFNLKQISLSDAEDFMGGMCGRADPPVITLVLPLAVSTFVY